MEAASRDFVRIGRELAGLKESLIYMNASEISEAETAELAIQISAIRLQLKRLLADQKVLGQEIERRALGR
jgi:hypothetical protein